MILAAASDNPRHAVNYFSRIYVTSGQHRYGCTEWERERERVPRHKCEKYYALSFLIVNRFAILPGTQKKELILF